MTEKTVNEFAYFIQRWAILIVCQSADAKYPQDCFLSASRFSALVAKQLEVFMTDQKWVSNPAGVPAKGHQQSTTTAAELR